VRSFAFSLYLVSMCSWFLHMPTRYEFLASLRADLLLVALILGLIVVSTEGGEESTDRRTGTLLWALVIYAAVTIPFVEWPGSVVKTGFPNFFKAFVFFYFTAKLVTTEKRLHTVLMVFLACQTFRVLEPLYMHVTDGYWGSKAFVGYEFMNRLSGAPSDTVNPNGLASIVLTVVPLLHYLTAGTVRTRLLYISVLPMLLYALVLTASRSGMIGMAGIVGLIWLKSRHKIVLLASVVTLVILAIPYLGADLTDRYASIYSKDTKNASTAEDRFAGMEMNLHVALRRPLFGYGLGTSSEANFNYGNSVLPAHNLYLEVAQELGFLGLALYLAFIGSLLVALRRSAAALKRAQAPPAILANLIPALQVFCGVNLLFSFASYGLSQYDWYLVAGLNEAATRLLLPTAAAATVAVPAAAAPVLVSAFRPVATRS
jgi:putative inorganic carbon (HCO3(-)) transporter